MRGFLASLICALAIGAFGAYLLVSWFSSFELPR